MGEFDLEAKASEFIDKFYKERGAYSIEMAPNRKFDDWDKIVKFKTITYKIEEKARVGVYGDILIEIMEDVTTGDLGWFYQTKADKIIYIIYQKEEDELPFRVYAIDIPIAKKYFSEHIKGLIRGANISPKGYGLTLSIFLPLTIGKQIYPQKKLVDEEFSDAELDKIASILSG